MKNKKDIFKDFRKKFKITKLKTEAGRVVICERLLTHEKIASDSIWGKALEIRKRQARNEQTKTNYQ